MYRITLFTTLILLASCSAKNKNDLESMNIKGKVKCLQEKTFSNKNTLQTHREFSFNESGQVVSITSFPSSGQAVQRTMNHYNLWGRLIEQNFFEDDSLVLKQVYLKTKTKSDSILMYSSTRDLVSIGVLSYDKNDVVVESVIYDSARIKTFTESSEYNDNGKLIRSKISSLDSIIDGDTYLYTYDSQGRVNSYSYVNRAGELVQDESYTYTTDQFNNWVEKTIVDTNGDKIGIVKRKLEYN